MDDRDDAAMEASVMEAMHDASMSEADVTACMGRIGKEIVPVFVRAMASEEDRGTNTGTVVSSVTILCAGLIHAIIVGNENVKSKAEVVKTVSGLFEFELTKAVLAAVSRETSE